MAAWSVGCSSAAVQAMSGFCAATAAPFVTSSALVTTEPTRSQAAPSPPARAQTDSQRSRFAPLDWNTKKFSHCFSRSFLPGLTKLFFFFSVAAPKPALRGVAMRVCGAPRGANAAQVDSTAAAQSASLLEA